MELDIVKDAVHILEARGVPLAEITSPMVREITGYGSYSSITEHLRTIRGEAHAGSEAIDDGSPAHEETALAVLDDTLVDIVQAAEQALAHAQRRLQEAEAQIPELERLVQYAYRQIEETSAVHLRRSYAVSKGALPSDDRGVREAEQAMWHASRAHREAHQQLENAPTMLAQAKAAVRLATQEVAKARHLDRLKAEHPHIHAEYEQAVAELKAFEPDYDKPGESIRAKARLSQRVQALETQIRELCEGFESMAV